MNARVGLVLIAMLAGCTRHNKFFCNDPNNATDPECLVDSSIDGPPGASCGSDADCTDPTMTICDTSTTPGHCAECTTADPSPCTGVKPVCANDVCRGCTIDDDCTSKFCDLGTGACASSDNVLYVQMDAAGTTCAQTDPCGKLSDAIGRLDAMHAKVHMESGNYSEGLGGTTVAHNMDLHGNGAVITNDSSGDLLDLSAPTAITVTMLDVVLTANAAGGNALVCGPSTGLVHLNLQRVEIANQPGVGLTANTCALVIDRANVHDNGGGGIDILKGSFQLTNSMIAGNGTGNSTPFGGVRVEQVSSQSLFALDTITGNHAAATAHSGLECGGNSSVKLTSNIVFGNDAPGVPELSEVTCTSSYTITGAMPLMGSNNSTADPLLDTSHHLGSGSPAIDAGDPALTIDHDFDGDPRPAGNGYDIGADEVP